MNRANCAAGQPSASEQPARRSGTTTAESGFGNLVGARLDLPSNGLPAEYVLFGEDASRVVISCDPAHLARIQQLAEKNGVGAEPIGVTVPENLEIAVDGRVVVSGALADLRDTWAHALERALHAETEERLVPATLQKS